MKFSSREDIAAPIDRVFAAISDFDAFERAILRRGATLERTDDLEQPGCGMAWKCSFPFRGKTRVLDAELVNFDWPELLKVESVSSSLNGYLSVELVPLSPRQTRLAIELELKPRSMSARLFLQSLRLAKASLTKKFKTGVRKFARDLEYRIG
ncbi:SRPBCC family protein [Actibacterium lipolyticum]|uniref:Polyketide cyclase / dehydrase and lipid transport n=1 Tax=Actibacterium lipolyticum TaxID=1524263 RepID=A0A238KQX3_9RHOB|nr:SRPBCC family protein [Actibacterium lipolyticum]SMX45118.1 Polyketide cyclase / dehydrase and lipid transport [Actibacterium lipolyticum]